MCMWPRIHGSPPQPSQGYGVGPVCSEPEERLRGASSYGGHLARFRAVLLSPDRSSPFNIAGLGVTDLRI